MQMHEIRALMLVTRKRKSLCTLAPDGESVFIHDIYTTTVFIETVV